MEQALGRAIQCCLAVLLLAVAAVGLLLPRNSWFVFDVPVVVGVCGVALAGAFLASRLGSRGWVARRPWLTVAGGGVAAGLVAGVAAASAMIRFGWDARAVFRAATALAAGEPLDPHTVDYFARFPNNVPLLGLETVQVQLGQAVGLPPLAVPVAAQVLAAGIITVCLGATAVVLGRPGRVVPVQLATVALVALSPHLGTPYSDVPAAVCVAGAVLTLTVGSVTTGRRRVLHLATTAVLLGLGAALKPFVAVLLIALVLVILVAGVATGTWPVFGRTVGVAVLVGLLSVGTSMGAITLARQVTGLTQEHLRQVREPFPMVLWMASGTYDTGEDSPVRRYGGYRQDLVDLAASMNDPVERRQVLTDRVREQLAEQGVAGNLSFFSRKAAWVWGDGTFWAYGEGTDSQQASIHTDGALAGLAEWNAPTGEHYRTRASAINGLWLALLLWVGVHLLRARPERLTTVCSLALLGLTAYLLIFEARPRYVLALAPVVLALAVATAGREARRASPPG